MHEIVPRGRGGKVSSKNSIACCGTIVGAVPSCHTYLQLHQIDVVQFPLEGAEGALVFRPNTRQAADWMKIALPEQIESQPMQVMEAAE